MIARLFSSDTHLATSSRSSCERRVTFGRHTLLTILLGLSALTAGCGGNKGGSAGGDTYARGTQVQESCCEHLSGPGRDGCLKQIVRIDDHTVASSAVNQATYTCVVDHFTCDTATGHATQPSAQAQLECIQDLQVSSR